MYVSVKRVVLCYTLAVVLLFICVLRVFAVMQDPRNLSAAISETSRKITINISRGSIFDSNNQRLTNDKNVFYVIIFNKPTAIATLYKYFTGSQVESITDEIKKQGFALRTISQRVEVEGIYCFSAYSHADDSLAAKHIIGYTNDSGRGVCGIEAAYDDVLAGTKENTITFSLDGQGNILKGAEPQVSYDYAKENTGVRLTLDKRLQQIAEQKAMTINEGAVIVTEISSGKIKALVSRPDYKLSDLGSAVESEKQPLLNRALCVYNIGSVFKPYIAAAGYEKGLSTEIDCVGYTNVDGLNFTCHNLGGHGKVNMTSAIKYSCNSYFYSFIQNIEVQSVTEIAKKAGFDSGIYLAKGIVSRAGSFGSTAPENLSKRALCNFSIGQGELMLSPLAITNLYAAIANSGVYTPQYLVEGTVKNGAFITKEETPATVRVMSEQTASRLKYDLAEVLTEGGTGQSAQPTRTTAAGKTGTAQTGIVRNGEKITNSWFCGFFPFDSPKYAVTVLAVNHKGGVGEIFASIADEITFYEQNIRD